MSIIAILLVLMAPAFTTLKSAGDVTSAAYTIKGVLDQARTYATANNTYTWVGFFEENVSNPSSPNSDLPAIGRLITSTIASKDGTNIYGSSSVAIDPTKLIQIGKLAKIENVHLLTHTDAPSGQGSTLDTRPNVASTYCIGDSSPSASTNPFQYPVGNPAPAQQYAFVKAVQFSPSGEARINNNSNPVQAAAEILVVPTHGIAFTVPAVDAKTHNYLAGNLVAIQCGGVGGDVIIYRK
jgi:hypothetical protein